MATAVATTTCSTARGCRLRAYARARAEKLISYPNADGSWSCKNYTIRVTGAGWSARSCPCAAGSPGRVSKHLSVVAKAIAVGVQPIRRTEKGGAAAYRAIQESEPCPCGVSGGGAPRGSSRRACAWD